MEGLVAPATQLAFAVCRELLDDDVEMWSTQNDIRSAWPRVG